MPLYKTRNEPPTKRSSKKMQKTTASSSRVTLISPFFFIFFFLLAFILSLAVFYSAAFAYIHPLHYHIPTNSTISATEKTREKLPFAIGEAGCDVFEGKWTQDYNRPPYEEWECPYLEPQTTCLEHGRPEKDFRYWSWQPHGCSIPRFNATLMLEALRGKRMMFVGDSLNRGQFISMVCLLQKAISPHEHSMEVFGSLTVFTAKEYNVRVEFYWAPFLLESNSDDPLHHRVTDRIIRNGSIGKHGHYWAGADIILFNTYIWWISGLRLLRGSFEDEVKDIVKIGREDGYRMAMIGLIQWINENIDAKGKRVFFITMSPTHQWSYKWGGISDGNCYNETSIIQDPTYFAAENRLMDITIEVLSTSRVPITLVNITQMSSVRKDAHVSIYKQQWPPLTEEELAKPASYADCIHWCLPGLPDIWNDLLFAKLFYP